MSLTHAFGNPTGSVSSSVIQPVTVWDDAFADITEEDAVNHAYALAPGVFLGLLPTDDPSIEVIAGHVIRVGIEYTPAEIKPRDPPPTPETGTLVRRFSFQAQGKRVTTPLEPIAVFDEDGDATSDWPDTKWCVNATGKGFEQFRNHGIDVEPLPETFSLDYYAPNSEITKEYLDAIAGICGHFNSSSWNDYPQGSLQLVRVTGSERTPDDWELSFGFGYAPPRFDVQIGAVTINELRGSWIYWTRQREYFVESTNVLEVQSYLAFVQRVWDESDFAILDLPDMS